jgi:hypothetical protein
MGGHRDILHRRPGILRLIPRAAALRITDPVYHNRRATWRNAVHNRADGCSRDGRSRSDCGCCGDGMVIPTTVPTSIAVDIHVLADIDVAIDILIAVEVSVRINVAVTAEGL